MTSPREVTGRDEDRQAAFLLAHPEWHFITPVNGYSKDGKWHATNRKVRLTGDTHDALMDQLDWFHTT